MDLALFEDNKDFKLPELGWLCTYTPEEVIQAFGFVPSRILTRSHSTKLADAYLHHNLCPYIRTSLDHALRGENNSLKGAIITNSCDAMRSLYHVWKHYVRSYPFLHFLNIPKNTDSAAVEYFKKEIQNLITVLEEFTGERFKESNLLEAIEDFNESRDLIKELDGYRKNSQNQIRGSDFLKIVMASQSMPKKNFNEKLKDLLKNNFEESVQKTFAIKPRIMLVGSLLSDIDFVESIEDLGASVVCDDLCCGRRYFENKVKVKEDPIEALSIRYLQKPPCPRMKTTKERIYKTRELVEKHKVDGIVYKTLKFCDNHLYDFPAYAEFFHEIGIPILQIEDDFKGGNQGQIRTRVEAFIEML